MLDIEMLRELASHHFGGEALIEPFGDGQAVAHLPFVSTDGDGVVAYFEQTGAGWRISDKGMTLMRLSYQRDLDRLLTGSRQQMFTTLLAEFHLQETDGELWIHVPTEHLMDGLFLFGKGCIAVEGMGSLNP